MRLAALFSGGKDSTYSVFMAKKMGHSISCLVSLKPKSEQSMLLHYPSVDLTRLQSESMNIPHVYAESDSDDVLKHAEILKQTLLQAKDDYSIQGLVHGGIQSNFQKKHFANICDDLGLELVSPVWQKDPKQYMRCLIWDGFRFIIVAVSSGGLDDAWLGCEITLDRLSQLETLSEKFGFNLNFEGGEAETLVVDCPLFSRPLSIVRSAKIWDGYRGRFEIQEARLE